MEPNDLRVLCHIGSGAVVFDCHLRPGQDGQLEIVAASVSSTVAGGLTADGINAFRALCLAECMVQRALGLPYMDPQEEIAALRTANRRLNARLDAIEKEEGGQADETL